MKYNKSITIKSDYSVSWKDVTTYLDGSAVTFLLQDSQIYGDHFVLGVGYVSFEFSSGWVSNYIQIVDGWSNEDFRYVNHSLGIGSIMAVRTVWKE